MALVRSKDTKPELIVRRLAHRLGYRFRLHRRDLPGHPDLVFPSRRKVVFVHGCFWHRHPGCKSTRTPKTRVAFWKKKFQENVLRDAAAQQALAAADWRTLVLWECEVKDVEAVAMRLTRFLGPSRSKA